jgi:hypothetical protein
MPILYTLGPITFDLSALISFLIGVSFGFLILLMIYLYAVIKSMNKGLKLRGVDETDIDEEEIKWLIQDAQKLFKDKETRTTIGYGTYLLQINKELSIDIAKKFYPFSKYPYLELTIDETLLLNHYITNRLEQVMSGKILRMFRGMTISKIVEMNDTKTKIEQSAIVKTAKKYGKVTSAAIGLLNIMNPVYWFRRLTQEQVINIMLVKIGLALIAITGEETYKIYSKKVFNVEKTITTDVDKLYEEIQKDLMKEAKEQ